MPHLSPLTFLLAFLGGILPAFLWLVFWLREDRLDPEPRDLLIATFAAGMVATLVALITEGVLRTKFPSFATDQELSQIGLILWAGVEELAKFGAAFFIVLKRRENDEPIDNMIYLITAALGFAALENALFLLDPLSKGYYFKTLITSDMRFLGSTLLHVVSSATVGIAMAFAFCKLPHIRTRYTAIGLVLATVLHTLFNLFILRSSDNLISVFVVLWVGVIILLLFFERVKRINKSCVY
jgi:RsiW-degrading membrane proteinase PrsW (M82 family)